MHERFLFIFQILLASLFSFSWKSNLKCLVSTNFFHAKLSFAIQNIELNSFTLSCKQPGDGQFNSNLKCNFKTLFVEFYWQFVRFFIFSLNFLLFFICFFHLRCIVHLFILCCHFEMRNLTFVHSLCVRLYECGSLIEIENRMQRIETAQNN